MGIMETLIVTTAIAGVVGTGIGGLVGAMLQKDSNRTVSLLLSFAGGVMLSVVCFDLVTEAIETDVGIFVVIGSIALGVIVTYVLNYLIDRKTNPEVPHIDENHPKTADDLDELIHSDPMQFIDRLLEHRPIPGQRQLRAMLELDLDLSAMSHREEGAQLQKIYGFSMVEHKLGVAPAQMSDARTQIALRKHDGKTQLKILRLLTD